MAAASAAKATATATGLTMIAYGGLRGSTYATHVSGDVYDYAEDVTVDFDRTLVASSITPNVTISPAAPFSTYVSGYGKRVQVTIRKVPGVHYALTLGTGIAAQDGTHLAGTAMFSFTTPSTVVIPAPSRSTAGERYRYGVGAHPFSASLAGPTADQQISLFAGAGVRFVRIDYTGDQIEPQQGTYSFTTEDGILDKLAARGITEMPLITQYSAPTWATGGAAYPAIWSTPGLYASYAGAVAAHLAAKYPQVTHVELFNEPNLSGWWTNTNSAYAATDGSSTAAYAKAAYAAIKAAAPRMVVVGPALADGGPAVDPRLFLATMMQNGCRVGTCWDALSVHAYRWLDPTYNVDPTAMNRFSIYKDLQQVALANGETAIPHVFITEWAFSTDSTSPVAFDPKVQARYVALGFNLMLADPTLDGISYTNLYNPATDFWGRTSLTQANFSTLPAYQIYKNFATF